MVASLFVDKIRPKENVLYRHATIFVSPWLVVRNFPFFLKMEHTLPYLWTCSHPEISRYTTYTLSPTISVFHLTKNHPFRKHECVRANIVKRGRLSEQSERKHPQNIFFETWGTSRFYRERMAFECRDAWRRAAHGSRRTSSPCARRTAQTQWRDYCLCIAVPSHGEDCFFGRIADRRFRQSLHRTRRLRTPKRLALLENWHRPRLARFPSSRRRPCPRGRLLASRRPVSTTFRTWF